MVCYIGVGSNLGDRWGHIRKAIGFLRRSKNISLKRVSSIYETDPQGGPKGQDPYLNLACEVETKTGPHELLAELKKIEKKVGRKDRKVRWAPREIDLDILFYGDLVTSEKALKVPHPLIAERGFVLRPLADLVPFLRHPGSGLTVQEMLKALKKGARWRKADEEIVP